VIRKPAAAGLFYPADREVLAARVDALLGEAGRRPDEGVLALVAPHAGYDYSGRVAASAFAIAPDATEVVLLGPSHFVPLAGMALSSDDAWETPLGEVRVSKRLRKEALAAGAFVDDEPHARDHALEVVLPFLQRVCRGGAEILPVAVGSTLTTDVARLIETLGALAVVSTDLSHYLPDEAARRRDRETSEAVLRLQVHAIRDGDACGVFALRGLVEHARRHDLDVELLDLRTSADATGDRGRVVGYGAFAIRSSRPSG
jgi:AmmeMemoRadiSam system protein B